MLVGRLQALQLEHKKILEELEEIKRDNRGHQKVLEELEEIKRYSQELENQLDQLKVMRTILLSLRSVVRPAKRLIVVVRNFWRK